MQHITYKKKLNLYIGYTCPLCGSLELLHSVANISMSYDAVILDTKSKYYAQAIEEACNTIISDVKETSNGKTLGEYISGKVISFKGMDVRITIPYIKTECQFCGSVPPWITGSNKKQSFPSLMQKSTPTVLLPNNIGKWFGIAISLERENLVLLKIDEEEKSKYYRTVDETKREKNALETELNQYNKSLEQTKESFKFSNALKHFKLYRDVENLTHKVRETSSSLNKVNDSLIHLQRWKAMIENDDLDSTSKCETFKDSDGLIEGGIVSYTFVGPNDRFEHKELTDSLKELMGKEIEIIYPVIPEDLTCETESEISSTQPDSELKEENESVEITSQEKAQAKVLFCHKCGNRLRSGSAFCSKCGTKIE